MPIQFPEFNSGNVPVPRKTEVPKPEIPDTANIIMQAAQMSQHAQLQREQMRQEAYKTLSQAIESTLALNVRKEQVRGQFALASAMDSLRGANIGSEIQYRNFMQGFGSPTGSPPAQSIAQEVASGKLKPTMGLQMMGKGATRMLLEPEVKKLSPNFDWNAAEAAGTEQQTMAGPTMQNRIKTLDSLLPKLKLVSDINDSIPRSNFTTINKYGLSAAAAAGDRTASLLMAQLSNVAISEQRVTPQGSDSRFHVLEQQVGAAKTQEQLNDAIRTLYTDYVNDRNIFKNQPAGTLTNTEKKHGMYIEDMSAYAKGLSNDTSPGSMMSRLFGFTSGGESREEMARRILAERRNGRSQQP